MLTVDFKVNGDLVMRVHAHNRGRARSGRTGAEVYNYTWAIERGPRLEFEPAQLTGQLVHAREDGAVALAHKIFEQACGPAALRPSGDPVERATQARIEVLEQALADIVVLCGGDLSTFVRRNGQRAIYDIATDALARVRHSAPPASEPS